MVKRSKRGKRSKRTKKRHTKKRNKRYSRKKTLKGGRLTPRQHELLRKVNPELGGRTNYCRKKNKFRERNINDCINKGPVCRWGIKRGETSARCMKDDETIRSLNYGLVSDYYPPFTKIHYKTMGDQTDQTDQTGQIDQTTISQIPNLISEGIINDSTLVWMEGMERWKLLGTLNLLESPVQGQAPPRPPRDHESMTEPEPVTLDDTRPVVDSTVVDAWIIRRDDNVVDKKLCNKQHGVKGNYSIIGQNVFFKSDIMNLQEWGPEGIDLSNCIYFDPETTLDIVYEVLRREAKSGSNVYLNIDVAHGRLTGQETSLNSNLHLLVIPARGTTDRGGWYDGAREVAILKMFLDDDGDEDLFNNDPDRPYMTLRGSLLFYTLVLLHLYSFDSMVNVIRGVLIDLARARRGHEHLAGKKVRVRRGYEIRASQILKTIGDVIDLPLFYHEILFRILKLYNSTEKVNDIRFSASREEEERKEKILENKNCAGVSHSWRWRPHKFGLTILYTNLDDINKYIHLPLDEDNIKRENGDILLSQILNYLKPLENLNHKFFMNHSSCRLDDEYYKDGYNPDLSSLTREISTPKENVHKQCFINYFQEPQKKEVRGVLSDVNYPTLIDYYVWLESRGRINAYIDILTEHGEGSLELYEFIMKNH